MQLTIEVLPAPFGPMIENSSPSFTLKETSVSARTPPKRSDTPRTSNVFDTHSLRIWRLCERSLSSVCRCGDDLTSGPQLRPSDYGGWPGPALMRGNAAPRARANGGISARWPSIGQCDSLKCLLPDNWSGFFAGAAPAALQQAFRRNTSGCATADAIMIAADYLKRIAAWSRELNKREIEVARA